MRHRSGRDVEVRQRLPAYPQDPAGNGERAFELDVDVVAVLVARQIEPRPSSGLLDRSGRAVEPVQVCGPVLNRAGFDRISTRRELVEPIAAIRTADGFLRVTVQDVEGDERARKRPAGVAIQDAAGNPGRAGLSWRSPVAGRRLRR